MDPRKTKRLAHRLRRHARRHRLFAGARPAVWTSPLRRSFDVGRLLRRWGWTHHVDPRLCELDFGTWDGQPWSDIQAGEIDAWCQDFPHARPGGGESVDQLLRRCEAFIGEHRGHARMCLVGHAGWINALRWLTGPLAGTPPTASGWPMPLGHARGERFEVAAA